MHGDKQIVTLGGSLIDCIKSNIRALLWLFCILVVLTTRIIRGEKHLQFIPGGVNHRRLSSAAISTPIRGNAVEIGGKIIINSIPLCSVDVVLTVSLNVQCCKSKLYSVPFRCFQSPIARTDRRKLEGVVRR